MNIWKVINKLIVVLIICCIGSCKDENMNEPKIENLEPVRIAVVLPIGKGETNWERVINWAKENITKGNNKLTPEFEYYDENTVDIKKIGRELSQREDITAIIGCLYSENTQILAQECIRTKKTIFTISTSNELMRAFGEENFLWFLAESDIAQCEMLLLKAKAQGGKRVSLFASNNIYGKTFTEWFTFQAVELGLEVGTEISYHSNELEKSFAEVIAEDADFLICAAADADEVCRIVQSYHGSKSHTRLLFSDTAYSPQVIKKMSEKISELKGYTLAPDPKSGFTVSYNAYFDENPSVWEAYVYDAVMVSCYAHRYAQLHKLKLNEAIQALLKQEATVAGMWTDGAIADVFRKIEAGQTPALSGASGALSFSESNYTLVQYSTYMFWQIYDGNFISLSYDTRVTDNEGSLAYGAWAWHKQMKQEFDNDYESSIIYPSKSGNYAVVVAASETWDNYRHQADALTFYQLLKQNGFDDQHIVLIMADDIAENPKNPEQGIVRHNKQGENMYKNVVIDYKLADLTPQDMEQILLGLQPNGLNSSSHDNVLFFWSGHGKKDKWLWGTNRGEWTSEQIQATFKKMSEQNKYRKMLCFIETCYSGSVAKACEGIPKLLLYTAANEKEHSKAYMYNYELGTFMTNRFTDILLHEANKHPKISLHNLYKKLFNRTLGSHVKIYNDRNYGNLFENTLEEFLHP